MFGTNILISLPVEEKQETSQGLLSFFLSFSFLPSFLSFPPSLPPFFFFLSFLPPSLPPTLPPSLLSSFLSSFLPFFFLSFSFFLSFFFLSLFLFFYLSIFLLSCWAGKNSTNKLHWCDQSCCLYPGVQDLGGGTFQWTTWVEHRTVQKRKDKVLAGVYDAVLVGEIIWKSCFSSPPLCYPSFLKNKTQMLCLLIFLAICVVKRTRAVCLE